MHHCPVQPPAAAPQTGSSLSTNCRSAQHLSIDLLNTPPQHHTVRFARRRRDVSGVTAHVLRSAGHPALGDRHCDDHSGAQTVGAKNAGVPKTHYSHFQVVSKRRPYAGRFSF
jgi:hypothetical protein